MLVMKDSDYLTVEFVVVSSPKKKKKIEKSAPLVNANNYLVFYVISRKKNS